MSKEVIRLKYEMNKVGKKSGPFNGQTRTLRVDAACPQAIPLFATSHHAQRLGASRRRLRVDHACQGANVCSAELNGPVVTNNSSIKLILSK